MAASLTAPDCALSPSLTTHAPSALSPSQHREEEEAREQLEMSRKIQRSYRANRVHLRRRQQLKRLEARDAAYVGELRAYQRQCKAARKEAATLRSVGLGSSPATGGGTAATDDGSDSCGGGNDSARSSQRSLRHSRLPLARSPRLESLSASSRGPSAGFGASSRAPSAGFGASRRAAEEELPSHLKLPGDFGLPSRLLTEALAPVLPHIDRKLLLELRGYLEPVPAVRAVLECVHLLLGGKPDWGE